VPALGTSFTKWRAESLGLDYQKAFARICAMGFAVVRLSASWRELAQFGYAHLDWLVNHSALVGQRIVLTVGMKALGWPEFYLPEGLDPSDAAVQREAMAHVEAVVRRFARQAMVVAWQIENEPFDRSGPQARWIPRRFIRREAQAVRSIDGSRPLIVSAFAHFDENLDRASSRHQSEWLRRLRLDLPAEREALAVLRAGDILGLDVYRSIGWIDEAGRSQIGQAMDDQFEQVRRWQRIAREQGKRLWIMEAQAEPWEARRQTHGDPLTIRPDDIGDLVRRLADIGVETILLWGSEYWLWREENADPRWVASVALVLKTLA
jgi:Cellulase (glycosyl hydrolase family 5)